MLNCAELAKKVEFALTTHDLTEILRSNIIWPKILNLPINWGQFDVQELD